MQQGKRIAATRPIDEIAHTARRSREELPAVVRAIDRTEIYPVEVTPALRALAESSKRNRETENSRTRELENDRPRA
jgi:hypothetical protein